MTPWTAAHQASLFFSIFQSLLKFMSNKSVVLSNHLILYCPLLRLHSIIWSIWVFSQMSQFFPSVSQSIGALASASIFPINIQGWFHLGLTALISLPSKGLSRVFSSTTIWKFQLFSTQPSLWSNSHNCKHDYWKNHRFDCTKFYQESDVSAF